MENQHFLTRFLQCCIWKSPWQKYWEIYKKNCSRLKNIYLKLLITVLFKCSAVSKIFLSTFLQSTDVNEECYWRPRYKKYVKCFILFLKCLARLQTCHFAMSVTLVCVMFSQVKWSALGCPQPLVPFSVPAAT